MLLLYSLSSISIPSLGMLASVMFNCFFIGAGAVGLRFCFRAVFVCLCDGCVVCLGSSRCSLFVQLVG